MEEFKDKLNEYMEAHGIKGTMEEESTAEDFKAGFYAANGALNIADVSGSYFEVDFGGHLKAQMLIEDGKLKVTAAMNGWGDPVDVSTVRFIL